MFILNAERFKISQTQCFNQLGEIPYAKGLPGENSNFHLDVTIQARPWKNDTIQKEAPSGLISFDMSACKKTHP